MENPINGLKAPKYSDYSISSTILEDDEMANGVDLVNCFEHNILKALLYKYGFDLSKGATYMVCEHRNSYGERVAGALFMGVERADKRWVSLKKMILEKAKF